MTAFLSDGVVSLRPVAREDLAQLAAWRNDPELRSRTREFRPLTDVDQEQWLQRISGPARRDFMFVVAATVPAIAARRRDPSFASCRVGVVGLCGWEPVNATAEISFYVGDPEFRRCGITTRALRLLQVWGFTALRLERIWAECYAFNEPGLRVLEKLGYAREGVLRRHVWRNGDRHDSVMLGLLRSEWEAQ